MSWGVSGKAGIRARVIAVAAALLCAVPVVPAVSAASPAVAAEPPTVELSQEEAGKGGTLTVTGKGWRSETLLMMLICGRATVTREPVGGTNACANADGRTATTDANGSFSKKIPVAEPPVACPCVVRVTTVTGEKAAAQAEFKVAGHPVKPLPDQEGGGKLAVLAAARLEGSGSLLTWFGAPASRTLVATVGNLGSAPVKDPIFKVGTSHGVFAPQWEEQQWRGTVAPGQKAQVKLEVQLSAGAHGDYLVSLRYGGKVLAEQPWDVGRPWGVTLFWILLAVVVPAAVFRIGMAIVDRVRPRRSAGTAGGHRGRGVRELAVRLPRLRPRRGPRAPEKPDAPPPAATLPWFTPDSAPGLPPDSAPGLPPDSVPGAPARISAPRENRTTTPMERGQHSPRRRKGNT